MEKFRESNYGVRQRSVEVIFHIIMNEKLKSKFPTWCFENQPLAVTLTDDVDSLIGCAIEKQIKGNTINYFYDFNNVYTLDKNVQYPTLGIDLAFTYGKCWDNHVTRLNKRNKTNSQSANINSIQDISGENYFDKYCMSTAITMWSFYDLPLPQTKLGKMILLSVDSGFSGHYDERFKKVHTKYLEMLGFDELIDLLNKTDEQDFFDILKRYKLNAKNGGKIHIDKNGYLQTSLPLIKLSDALQLQLKLPAEQFNLHKQFVSKFSRVTGNEIGNLDKDIISFAVTGKNHYKFTRRITNGS